MSPVSGQRRPQARTLISGGPRLGPCGSFGGCDVAPRGAGDPGEDRKDSFILGGKRALLFMSAFHLPL